MRSSAAKETVLRIASSVLCLAIPIAMPSSTLGAEGNEVVVAEQVEFFEKRVRPLLVTHCYECHAGEEIDGGLSVESRSGLIKGGETGPAIVLRDPEKSLLIEAVRYANEDLQMPPTGQLKQSEVAILARWVTMGAPDPRTEVGSSSTNPATGMTVEEGRDFWSFQPVENWPVPRVKDETWVRTPIDSFVLSKLESHGIEPAQRADRTTLIRRVTFDMVGLPPTPEEIDAFVEDPSSDAYRKLVERLLSSPAYGVRWGRHWLDVARYADSNGLDENLAFGNAWRYRDYIVNSFNNDKPFDRFLVEQIAGDLLPDANRETKTATGFLVLGAKVLAEPDREKLEMDSIDEQLDTFGKAFLGMTFGCVRCHDHKFDPIKQTDYYALAAIFKSTKTFGDSNTGAIKHWNEHSFATDQQKSALKEIDAQIAKRTAAANAFKSKTITNIRDTARANATDYLVAATKFEPTTSLTEVSEIATSMDLHPRILHHCRLHLHYHQDDPVFGAWHVLSSTPDAVDKHYRTLFTESESAFAAARAKDPAIKKLGDERLDQAHWALLDLSGFLAVPPKPEFAFDQQQLAQYYDLMEQARLIESHAPDEDAAMGVTDSLILDTLPIHIRGNHRSFGDLVARDYPAVMRTSMVRPIFPSNESGRLQLAQWMASTQHPLTARVYANRIWRGHFGGGLVRTTENFGVLGERPSHPELLDWLARYLMHSSWSTKKLHRLILTSNTYQMASARHDANSIKQDPENRLLSRFPIQRLDAEQIRDSMLVVSGRLDDSSIGGKTIPLRNRQFVFNHTSVDHTKYDSLRRAIYLPVVRNNLYSFFSQFDFPDPTMPTGDRAATVVAPQSLLLMNSDLVIDSSESFASQVEASAIGKHERVDFAYRRALGRNASETERNRAVAFIDELTSHSLTGSDSIDPAAAHRAWALFCQSLFASNEFIYIK